MDLEIHSPFVASYMQAVDNTESPRLFHLWCSMSAIASALGRKAHVPMGMIGEVYPNHFVVLVGPPAVRKSSAIKIAYKLVKDSTNVRFAPSDTGGQRQGLIQAMSEGAEAGELEAALEAAVNDPFQTLDDETKERMEESVKLNGVDSNDKHTLNAFWSELSGALGQANYSLMDFLVQTYDGDDYKYRTRNAEIVLPRTLFNILAATTPSSLSIAMPPGAEGHGFLSRFILVHGDENYQSVVWPQPPDGSVVVSLKETLSFVNQNLHGAFQVDAAARSYAETLYDLPLEITDPRFQHYRSRRFTHLLKLSLVLAASRKDSVIVKDDIVLAHAILRLTEKGMPDALGQFGLSPIAKLKQGILEYLRSIGGPATMQSIQAAFHRDARPQDVMDAIADLKLGDAIVQTTNPKGTILVSAKRIRKSDKEASAVDYLVSKKS